MEVPYNLGPYFTDQPIQRLDHTKLKFLNPRKCWMVEKVINMMGNLSAQAQGLKRPLTTYDKLLDSDEGQVLYLLWKEIPENENASIIIGMLKIGYKNLYLMDTAMRPFQTTPLCILDFFVHEDYQRKGYGHTLFDYMLKCENSSAELTAIDKPSESMIQFMKKHYNLDEPIWQAIHFVVYPSFFENIKPCESNNGKLWTLSASAKTEANGVSSRASARKTSETVGGLMRDDLPVVRRPLAGPDTPQGRKISRDFGHHEIW